MQSTAATIKSETVSRIVILPELDLHHVRVVARRAFERAQIVVRFSCGLDARELCQRTALGTERAIQLHLVELARLGRSHGCLPEGPRRAGLGGFPRVGVLTGAQMEIVTPGLIDCPTSRIPRLFKIAHGERATRARAMARLRTGVRSTFRETCA